MSKPDISLSKPDILFCILCGTTLKISEGQERAMHWGNGDGWKHENVSDCLMGLRKEIEKLNAGPTTQTDE